jgi:hypothetical protein
MKLKALAAVEPWEWPASTADKLLAVLRDEKAPDGDRKLAVEMAGDLVVMNDALAEALLATIRDPRRPEELRERAAISLGPVLEDMDLNVEDEDDPFAELAISPEMFDSVRTSLRQLYQDETLAEDLRRSILEASVRSPQPWHRDAIRAAYTSSDRAWKLTAVFCMRYVKGFDGSISEALESQDPEILLEAVAAAGNWEMKGAWDKVKALLSSPDTEKSLLIAAIEAAPWIRPDQAVEVLEALTDSEDDDVVAAVDEAMAMSRTRVELGEKDHDEEHDEENEDAGRQ